MHKYSEQKIVCIFERKGNFTMYDLKTVHGKSSVGTQLADSFGQTNQVLLNNTSEYNARLLASDVKTYFESNRDAVEVLIFKGNKNNHRQTRTGSQPRVQPHL